MEKWRVGFIILIGFFFIVQLNYAGQFNPPFCALGNIAYCGPNGACHTSKCVVTAIGGCGSDGGVCNSVFGSGICQFDAGGKMCCSTLKCVCNQGWGSTQCNIPVCCEILATSGSVCSSHGTCTGPSICSCSSGFTGTDCESCIEGFTGPSCTTPICCGVDATNTSFVCSGHGTCTSPNICSCSGGFVGLSCDIDTNLKCFDIQAIDPLVCSQHGSCTSTDVCVCKEGFEGSSCNVTLCGDPVCANHGTCLGLNNCSCDVGFDESSLCEFPICNGIPSNNASVCSSHGTCTSPDNCVCDLGFQGDDCEEPLDCEESPTLQWNFRNTTGGLIDNSKISPIPFNFTVITGNLIITEDGISSIPEGPDLILEHNSSALESKIISNIGENHTTEFFFLTPQPSIFMNTNLFIITRGDIEIRFEVTNGASTSQSIFIRKINCSPNIGGLFSDSILDTSGVPNTVFVPGQWRHAAFVNSVSGMSVFIDGVVIGTSTNSYDPPNFGCAGFTESSRIKFISILEFNPSRFTISNYKTWDRSLSQSDLLSIFNKGHKSNSSPLSKFTCDGIPCLEQAACSGNNGQCIDQDTCQCNFPFTGPQCCDVSSNLTDCLNQICPNGQFRNETTGECETPTCPPGEICCPDGQFRNETSGECETPTCPPGEICCPDGQFKNETTGECETPTCPPGEICCPDGQFRNVTTDECETPIICPLLPPIQNITCPLQCFGINANKTDTVCSGHGVCIQHEEEGVCICDSKWFGEKCELTTCFGIDSNCKHQICSGHGRCIGPDDCCCDKGWTGRKCNQRICPSGLVPPKKCKNEQHTYHQQPKLDCVLPVCFGMNSLHPAVCNYLHGICVNHDECVCACGFSGNQCEIKDEYKYYHNCH